MRLIPLLALLPGALAPWVADVAERVQCPPDFVAVGVFVGSGVAVRVGHHCAWPSCSIRRVARRSRWSTTTSSTGAACTASMRRSPRSSSRAPTGFTSTCSQRGRPSSSTAMRVPATRSSTSWRATASGPSSANRSRKSSKATRRCWGCHASWPITPRSTGCRRSSPSSPASPSMHGSTPARSRPVRHP